MPKPSICDTVCTGGGIFQFRVNHATTKDLPVGAYVSSDISIEGCDCSIQYYPHGDSSGDGRGLIHFIATQKEPKDDGNTVAELILLDKRGLPCKTDPAGSLVKDEIPQTGSVGTEIEIHHYEGKEGEIEEECVADGCFVVLCFVAIVRDAPAAVGPVELLPPSCLGNDLAKMLDAKELTDVSFIVDGETFEAHRLVLAARSPVFRAELFGSMAESRLPSIRINDMEASTFRYMLHYIYRDSLPDDKEIAAASMLEFQNLLVAADQYALDSLKILCEEKLCSCVSVDSVISILELAMQHGCPRLKDTCLDFLKDGENFKLVATTDEYMDLMASMPSMLIELRKKFKKALSCNPET